MERLVRIKSDLALIFKWEGVLSSHTWIYVTCEMKGEVFLIYKGVVADTLDELIRHLESPENIPSNHNVGPLCNDYLYRSWEQLPRTEVMEKAKDSVVFGGVRVESKLSKTLALYQQGDSYVIEIFNTYDFQNENMTPFSDWMERSFESTLYRNLDLQTIVAIQMELVEMRQMYYEGE